MLCAAIIPALWRRWLRDCLQDLGDKDTKSDGLVLLESLLRLGIDDAFAVLREVDIRPGSGRRCEPRKRRRRNPT